MTRILAAAIVAVLVPAFSARADRVIVKDGQLHAAPSALSHFAAKVDKARLQSALFLRFMKDPKEEYGPFIVKGPEPLPAHTFASKASKPRVPKLEGCGSHPMEWLRKSKVVGKLKKREARGTILVELPAGFTPVQGPPTGLEEVLKQQELVGEGRAAECLKTTHLFAKEGERLAYTNCADDLNEHLLVFHQKPSAAWTWVENVTLTEECP